MKNVYEFLLTRNVTVGQLIDWMRKQDSESKEKILEFLKHRFEKRYIYHVASAESGFLIMAVSCLNIETLESFKRGIISQNKRKVDRNGNNIGGDITIFRSFFQSEQGNFPGFDLIVVDFYESIRCGILHQGETNNAWRIILNAQLLDPLERVIGAKEFLEALRQSLDDYIGDLRSKNMDDVLWKNAFFKLIDICRHCSMVGSDEYLEIYNENSFLFCP